VRRLVRTFLGCSAALAVAVNLSARQSEPLVLIDVGVEELSGQRVLNLTQDSFQILHQGTSRPIQSFTAPRQQSLSLVLLFDITASMESSIERKDLRAAVEEWFLGKITPEDRVIVGTFGRQIAIGPPIVGNPRRLQAAVRAALEPREIEAIGPSPIWDAVDRAVTALEGSPGRRAILLVTDGRATGNRLGPEEAATRAAEAGVLVSVLGEDWEMTLRQDEKTGIRVRPGVALEWIATKTGGLYLSDDHVTTTTGEVLDRLLADLRERYTLGFVPQVRNGQPQAFEVRVDRPGLKIRTRSTYTAK
jgi:VWFA-related protein